MVTLDQIFAIAVWIPVGVWIFMVIGWMIMAEIDGWVGLVMIGLALGLALTGSFMPIKGLAWLPLVMSTLTILAWSGLQESWRRYQLFVIDVERVEDIYEQMGGRGSDIYGMARMSEVLYARGMVHPAIALLDGALKGQPKDLFAAELKTLAGWKHDLGSTPLRTMIPCPSCSRTNPGGSCFCLGCGRPFLLDLLRRRWVGFSAWGLLFAVWGLLAVAVVATPWLTRPTVAPEIRLGVGIVAIVTALAAGGYFVVKGLRA
jgi:hypothetical protein